MNIINPPLQIISPLKQVFVIEKVLENQILKICNEHKGVRSAECLEKSLGPHLSKLRIEFEDVNAAWNVGMTYGILFVRQLAEIKRKENAVKL